MPARDAEATLTESVRSALGQTVGDLEVVVVDDGSRTPVREVLAELGDPRVRVIRHERSVGVAAARNAALAAARAPLVSQLDADDAWEPAYLASVLPCFEDPRIGLAYTNVIIVGHPQGHENYIFDASVHPMDRFPKVAEQNPVPALTATMRTAAVRRVGGYARWLRSSEDYHLYLKLIKAGWRFAYVDKHLARYRWPVHENALGFDRRRVEREDLKMWAGFALRHPVTPGPRRQVRLRAVRELRRLAGRD